MRSIITGEPFAYISSQDAAKYADLNGKYDVIIFGPGGGSAQSIVQGMPMWGNPIPWKTAELTPNIGKIASTDDVRPGLGWSGVQNLEHFVKNGGVFITAVGCSDFAIQEGLTNGVSMNTAARGSVTGTFLRMKLVDDASPIVYGVADNIAAHTDGGEGCNVSATKSGRGGVRVDGPRSTGCGEADDGDEVHGRPALAPENQAPASGPAPSRW